MRIVGGRFRGRALSAPRSQSIRPTTDRARESLFNILAHGYDDAVRGRRVLDLFAGTGALGLEALSRGSAFALFVEQSSEGCGLLRANTQALSLEGCTKIVRCDATKLGALAGMEPFDLVCADPPYGRALGERALAGAASGGWIAPGALVVLEESAAAEPAPGGAFDCLETRAFGDTRMRFYRHQPL